MTIGQLLSKSLVRQGYHIVVTQSYQSRIRGGHNAFYIRVSPERIVAPPDEIDVLITLDAEGITLHRDEMAPSGWILCDVRYAREGKRILSVPYAEFGEGEFLNMAAYAVTGCLLGLENGFMESMIRDTFGKKMDAAAVEKNLAVVGKAVKWVAERAQDIGFESLPKVSVSGRRIMVNGNEAIALGAMAAGVRCGFFYPMTPATSIMLTLIKHAKKMEVVVEQAEDEIAAVNMAIGASFCGARSMVATSGGGFALMTEGISLAAMTETPLVVAVAQRPGPATGLPTRTEQGDLEFILHGGHGEFPRAIFAPGSIEECFELTARAFEVAEASQGPVFVLTDQFLADSYRAVSPFEVRKRMEESTRPENGNGTYKRYAMTPDGISERRFPGESEALVVADSDEHTEEGHITEELTLRVRMVQKRMKKLARILEMSVPPTFFGDDEPETLFICWGSSWGAVQEAVEALRHEGHRAAMIHFSQVWPLRSDDFMDKLETAKRVIGVEGNATSQFARLIRRETGFEISDHITRYDGLPLTPRYILGAVARMEQEF